MVNKEVSNGCHSHTATIQFTKMHGAGNDYIYIDGTRHLPENLPTLARFMSERHCGIGSDGLVVITLSDIADFRMIMFNADGSEAQMCGNASRCIGKFVFEKGVTDKTDISLETKAGIKFLHLNLEKDKVVSVSVDMGIPILDAASIPVIVQPDTDLTVSVTVGGDTFEIIPVSMGNPHGVIFVSEISDRLVHEIGPVLENHAIWPEKANIEFCRMISRNEILMRVWERGSGETMACGTGACAAAVAAILSGQADREITVHLRGGDLIVKWDETSGHVIMTGPATIVADGIYYLSSLGQEIKNF